MPIQGPTLKPGNPSPCGCEVKAEAGTEKMRLWFCRTHAAAFEMLEALQVGLKALDAVAKELPAPVPEDHVTAHARAAIQMTIQKAADVYSARVA